MKKNLLVLFFLLSFASAVWAQCGAPTQLTLTAVTGTTADFTWHKADPSNTQWEVAFVLSGDTLNPDTTYAAAYDTTYSLSGLMANTAYDFYVRTFCSADTQSVWTMISFRTSCVALGADNLPYADNFDAYPGTTSYTPTEMTMPYCWSMYYGGSNTLRTYYPFLFNSYGDKFIRFNVQYTDDTRGDEVALLPEIDTNSIAVNTLSLKFQARRIVETPFDFQDEFRLLVGVMTDQNYATFVPVDTFVITSNDYAEYETVFNNYQGNGNRIALVATSIRPNTTVIFNSGSIDSVMLYVPTCSRPSEVHASNISTTSFDAVWTSTGSETAWELQYKASTDTVWTVINNVTSNPYTISNLNAETNYEYAVRADCGGTYSEWRYATAPVGTLACDTASQCHYTFSLSNNFTGWQGASISVYDNQVLIGTLTNTTSGTHTYQLGLCSGHTLSLVWHAGGWDSDCYFSLTDPNGYQIYSFSAGNAPTNNSTFFITLADCSVDSCARPAQVAVSQIQANSALVSWQAGGTETEWVVEYRVVPDTAWTDVPTAQNPCMLTGLIAATNYQVTVKAVCGGGEESFYADIVDFTTTCDAISLPYTENFNSYTNGISTDEYSLPAYYPNCAMPSCWSFINRSNNTTETPRAFLTNDAAYAVTGNSLLLTSSNTTMIYAVLPQFTDSLKNIQMRFKYRNEGTSTSNATLNIGYMTDPTDASTFHVVNIYSKVATFTEITQTFTEVPDSCSNCRIAFSYGGGSNMYFLAIDDIEIESTSACHKPTYVTVTTDATNNAVQLSWTETGSATSWQVEYGLTGFTHGAGTTVTVSENPCTFGDLIAGEIYDFYVRSICSPGDVSEWTEGISACPASYIMPTSGTAEVSMCGGVVFDDGGFNMNYAMNCDASLVVNPATAGSMVKLEGSFYIEPGYDYLIIYDGIAVGDSTDVVLFRSSISTDGTMLGEVPACTSTTGPLTIYFHSDNTTSYSGFALDVTCVGDEPACVAPTNLQVNNITENSAVAIWTAGADETSWNLHYKLASDTAWQSVNTNEPTFAMSGLTAASVYNVEVQAVCSETSMSEWVATSFTTQGTSVNSVDWTNGISIRPNPAETYVELTVNANIEVKEATVFNAFGQAIKHVSLTDNHARIDVSALASGMYFIRLDADNNTVTKKFIKK